MSSGPSRTGVGSLPGVLTLMALLRAVALALPTMHLWGLNAARFLPPWLRWTPLVISVATLHPAIGRLCLPGFEWLSRGRSLVLSILAVTLGLLIGFPDRVWFVGDYLLRMGIVSEAHGFETMFPQALPLDAIRHFWLPRTLGAWLHVAPTTIERALGVIEGAWLAVLACRFAKRMNAGPAATTAVALVVLFGGYFTLFTGYGKPTIEVCLFTAAAGAFGLELVRDNRSAIPFGLAVAAALAFHRSGWSILPGPRWRGSCGTARTAGSARGNPSRMRSDSRFRWRPWRCCCRECCAWCWDSTLRRILPRPRSGARGAF